MLEKDDLKDIGFYTLEDGRARGASTTSPLWRCELILTPACNFSCPYCRPIRKDYRETLTLHRAKFIVSGWASHGLRNVRFSGGEPTLWWGLPHLVRHARESGIQRIAISTNGSSSWPVYEELLAAGVNDFSVSLDACCSSTGDKMAGGVSGAWNTVVENIRKLAERTYVTVGVVATEDNVAELAETVRLASEDLGVADIRVIPAAQWDRPLEEILAVSEETKAKHPILRYRLSGARRIRGMTPEDSGTCRLVLDDMAVSGNGHFPCIIYLREQGDPIGSIDGKTMGEIREERQKWAFGHDTRTDPICQKNCLDVCVTYNNKAASFHRGEV